MKKFVADFWTSLGTTGKILFSCFLFYFICYTLG